MNLPITNMQAVRVAFEQIAERLVVLEPAERLRVLAACVCLFDREVGERVVELWRRP